jgi:hypothetical protein
VAIKTASYLDLGDSWMERVAFGEPPQSRVARVTLVARPLNQQIGVVDLVVATEDGKAAKLRLSATDRREVLASYIKE